VRILEKFYYGKIEPTEYDTASKKYKKLQTITDYLLVLNSFKLRGRMMSEVMEE